MAGYNVILALLVSFLFVAVSTPLIRKMALRWRLGDKPNGRRVHTNMIPHLGGIAIALGASLGLAVVLLASGSEMPPWVNRILAPVGLIVLLGLGDDMKNLKARQKLAVQILAALVLAVMGVRLMVGIPVLDASAVFSVLLTAFYLVGISSAVNLVDGLDGLAAGLSAISAAAFGVLSLIVGAPLYGYVALAIIGACLGFLVYNFPPGRIFMGDTGSMFLGILLGIVACSFTRLQSTVDTFFAVSLILAVPMLDAWLAIARRLSLHTPVFYADSLHIHHVLTSFGFSPRQTLAVLYATQAVLAGLGILVMMGFVAALLLGITLMGLLFAGFFRVMVASRERTARVAPKFPQRPIPSWEKSVPSLEK